MSLKPFGVSGPFFMIINVIFSPIKKPAGWLVIFPIKSRQPLSWSAYMNQLIKYRLHDVKIIL